jgi:hypothetical protein
MRQLSDSQVNFTCNWRELLRLHYKKNKKVKFFSLSGCILPFVFFVSSCDVLCLMFCLLVFILALVFPVFLFFRKREMIDSVSCVTCLKLSSIWFLRKGKGCVWNQMSTRAESSEKRYVLFPKHISSHLASFRLVASCRYRVLSCLSMPCLVLCLI